MWRQIKDTVQILPSRFSSLGRSALMQRGFTLLEMLIVVAIVGILASMTIPRYQAVVVQNEVDAVASELAQGLTMARTNAQSYAHSVKFCPVSYQQLHQEMPVCLSAAAAPAWQAWILIEMVDSVPTRVLMRSNEIPQSVQVCLSKLANSNECDSAAIDPTRIFNSMGQPSTVGFTIRVAARKISNVAPKILVLADSGRVRYV